MEVNPPEPPLTVNVGTVVPLPLATAWIRTTSFTETAGIGIVNVVAPPFEPVPEPAKTIAGSMTYGTGRLRSSRRSSSRRPETDQRALFGVTSEPSAASSCTGRIVRLETRWVLGSTKRTMPSPTTCAVSPVSSFHCQVCGPTCRSTVRYCSRPRWRSTTVSLPNGVVRVRPRSCDVQGPALPEVEASATVCPSADTEKRSPAASIRTRPGSTRSNGLSALRPPRACARKTGCASRAGEGAEAVPKRTRPAAAAEAAARAPASAATRRPPLTGAPPTCRRSRKLAIALSRACVQWPREP